jgi:hypothetical protein
LKGLTNAQKANILRFAHDSVFIAEYGQYHYRVALFDAFERTCVSADRLADFLLPPTSANWHIAKLLPELVQVSQDLELTNVKLILIIYGL